MRVRMMDWASSLARRGGGMLSSCITSAAGSVIECTHYSCILPLMTSGSSYFHTDGICVPDPLNGKTILIMVGTRSEHDPSWEVRTLPKIPSILLYRPSTPTAALEPYHCLILVVCVPMSICRRRAGVITWTRGVCHQLAPGLPLPFKRALPRMLVILV